MILVLGDGAATAHALTAAKQLGGDEIHILNLPPNLLAEPIAQVILTLDGYDAIVSPASWTLSTRPTSFCCAPSCRSRVT